MKKIKKKQIDESIQIYATKLREICSTIPLKFSKYYIYNNGVTNHTFRTHSELLHACFLFGSIILYLIFYVQWKTLVNIFFFKIRTSDILLVW
jgi:hypothetical protein